MISLFVQGEKRIIIKFRPAIEKRKVKNAFMTVTPTKLRYQNTSIPWIIGFNSAEAIIDTISKKDSIEFHERFAAASFH